MTQVATDIDPVATLQPLAISPEGQPEAISGGWDTALYRFRTADNKWHALRVFRSPDEAVRARREQIALRAAAAGGIPVPQVEAAGVWQDLPVVVLSWVPGRTIIAELQRRPWKVWRLGKAFGRMQALIHTVPAPEELRDPSIGNFGGDFVKWAEALDPALPARLASAGLSLSALIHSDYHPLNVMTDGQRITGVLDWPSAAAADPRVDVARTRMLIETGPIPSGPLKPLAVLLRGAFGRAWIRGYEESGGRVHDIAPFMVLAGLSWLQDLEWAAGRPGVWAEGLDAAPVRAWIEPWRRRAGMDAQAISD